MKFLKIKVSSSEIHQNFDANGRLESLSLTKSIIWFLLILISLNSAFLFITPNILIDCKNQIKFELRLSPQTYDLFRSFHNFGSLLGSIIFILVIEKVNHKKIIFSFLLINCICHFAFYLKLSFIVLLLSRFISGLVTMFCMTYFPFWVDKFGINNYIMFMQALIQISKILGNFIGHTIFIFLGSRKWNKCFLIESILVTITTFLMYLIPNSYYDKRYIDMERENKININIEKVEKESILKDIFLNIPLILLSLYQSSTIFINRVLQHYFYARLETIIYSDEKYFLFYSFLSTMIFPSIIGIIFGILFFYLKGGQNKQSFMYIFYFQFIACFFGFLSNKINSIHFYFIMLYLFNFFTYASIIISIIAAFAIMPKTFKGIGCGFISIIINLLSIVPSFQGYILINNYVGNSGVINALMLSGMIGCIEILIGEFYMRFNKVRLYKNF